MRAALLSSIREIAQSHRDMEQELAHAVNASSKAMDRVYGKPRAYASEGLNCSFVLEMVTNVRALRSETELLLAGKMALQQLDPPQKERLAAALAEMDRQLRKLADTPGLGQPTEPGYEEVRVRPASGRTWRRPETSPEGFEWGERSTQEGGGLNGGEKV
ncbi:PREDICTED: diacylglycerol kinase delta-like, partial [Dipodomys ordii]|uniref:Diacylglycerol kinase delta-like n=1 Tax=Dipodomys ordii TaxID=10020 RepID=A0A1S3GVG4_DIPOR